MSSRRTPRRGEVYDVRFDPVVGSEIGKTRPAVIVSHDLNNQYANTITVVPFTSATPPRNYPFEVRLARGTGGLDRDSRAKCDQVRTVDKQRMMALRGTLDHEVMLLVDRALKVHLRLT